MMDTLNNTTHIFRLYYGDYGNIEEIVVDEFLNPLGMYFLLKFQNKDVIFKVIDYYWIFDINNNSYIHYCFLEINNDKNVKSIF